MSRGDDLPAGIYLDDCSFAYDLVRAFSAAGFHVVTPLDSGLLGADDEAHLTYATQAGLALLTKNPDDFLHATGHAGVLAIYQDNIRGKDMTAEQIVQAVTNLFAAGVPVRGQMHTLNHWQY